MTPSGIRLGRIRGIEVGFDYSWILIFLLVTWSLASAYFPQQYPGWSPALYWVIGVATSILFFSSIVAHELAHSFTALRFGIRVKSITLFLFGGVASILDEPERPRTEFLITIAGPASSYVIAGVSWVLYTLLNPLSEPLGALLFYLALINALVATFNLAPGFPLDGGRVLRAVLWHLGGSYRRATRWATYAGQALAFVLIALGALRAFSGELIGGIWYVFLGWFLYDAAKASYRQAVIRSVLADVTAERLARRDFATVEPQLSLQDLVEAHVFRRNQHAYPVTRHGELLGLICLHDIRGVDRGDWETTRVETAMTPYSELITVGPDESAAEALQRLSARDVQQVPLVEGRKLVGLIERADVIRYLQFSMQE